MNNDTHTGVKAKQPDTYHGERVKLEEWILQLELLFRFNKEIKDTDKATYAATFMRGDAHKWIAPQLTKYLDNNDDDDDDDSDDEDDENTTLFENWGTFKTKLRQVFGVSNEKNKAVREIQRVKQLKSATDYAAKFQHYAVQTDWDDNALMALYRQGLKPKVKEELMRSGVMLDSMERLYEETIRIDNDLFELAEEMKGIHGYKNAHGRTQEVVRYFPQKGRSVPIRPRVRYTEEMDWTRDVNATFPSKAGDDFGKKKKYDKKSKDPRRITCYGCGKTGHIARNCRSKNKVTRFVNVTTKSSYHGEDEGESEWEILEPTPGEGRLMVDDPDSESGPEHHEDAPPPKKHRAERNARQAAARSRNDRREKRRLRLAHEWAPQETAQMYIAREPYEFRSDSEEEYVSPEESDGPKGSIEYDGEELARQIEELDLPNETANDEWENDYHRMNQHEKKKVDLWADKYVKHVSEHFIDCGKHEEVKGTKKPELPSMRQAMYDMDPRNQNHGQLHFSACMYPLCNTHLSDKEASYYPRNRSKEICGRTWGQCHNDFCPIHLYDKRINSNFPGKTPKQVVDMQIAVNRQCIGDNTWQTCLCVDCERHYEAKCKNGFAPVQSFLGTRLAPGIYTGQYAPQTQRN